MNGSLFGAEDVVGSGAESIPVNARVRAVPNVVACLRAAQSFTAEQALETAPARFGKLQAELIKARALLSFAPASGRPARFLDAKTGWALRHERQLEDRLPGTS